MMCSPSLTPVINPAGYLGGKIGGPVGKLVDPIGSVGRGIGGPIGYLVAPANMLTDYANSFKQPKQSSDGLDGLFQRDTTADRGLRNPSVAVDRPTADPASLSAIGGVTAKALQERITDRPRSLTRATSRTPSNAVSIIR